MDSRRTRTLAAIVLTSGLLAGVAGAHAAAAATCTLSAPARVKVGTPLAIAGSGFPASTSVDIEISLEGGTPDEFTVQSDARGGFEIELTPETADIGQTTVVARAGSGCTAQVAFSVIGPNSTPKPAATVPANGSAAGTGGEAAAPRTDAASTPGGAPSGGSSTAWTLAVLTVLIGVGGLIVTRPVRSR